MQGIGLPGEEWMNAGILVYAAFLFQAAGFVTRDELWLRLLVVAGSFLYIAYYFFFPAEPLWGAILASALLVAINLVLIAIILRERTLVLMPDREMMLFDKLNRFSPGQFRRLMRHAEWHTASGNTQLTREGELPDRLYFIMDGEATIRKQHHSVSREGNIFAGEIAFLYHTPASATVEIGDGVHYVSWEAKALRALMQRSAAMENAVIATLSRDMAGKVAASQPLEAGQSAGSTAQRAAE